MSLINEVLRELDKRHAPANERAGVPNEVRPLPVAGPNQKSPVKTVVTALLLAGMLACGWMYFPLQMDTEVPPVAATPDAPAHGVTGALSSSPSAVSPAPTSPAAGPDTPAPDASVAAEDEIAAPMPSGALISEISGLKLDTALSLSLPARAVASASPIVATSPNKTATPPAVTAEKKDSARASSTVAISPPATNPSTVVAPATQTASIPLTSNASSQMLAGSPIDEWTKAQTLLRSANPSEAEPLLKKLVESQPGSVPIRQSLIGLLLNERRYAEAIPVLKAGLVRHPDQSTWAMNLARLYVEVGDYSSAWDAIATGLPRAQQQADYLAFAGTILQRLERHPEAAAQYQAALRIRPDEARWWVGLGLALESSNRSAEARAAYLRAKGIGGYSADMAKFIDQKLQ